MSAPTEHTPGPWLDPDTLEWMHEPQRLLTNPANARIMGFAPDLLAACEAAEEWLEGWASAEPYISTIRAAIEKAKPRPPRSAGAPK
jgi:hypothetical protein